ncbi:17077_t:CDS:2, partial [Racocetra persica]
MEPFVGGGAAFLNIQPNKVIINDVNQELIIAYQVIKENPSGLIKLLTEYEKKHGPEFYQQLKSQSVKNLVNLEIAARFIYLNKTGYNGLYRVNSQGEFNVPWGQKAKVKLFDKENILVISEFLKKNDCQILNQDYQKLLPLIKEGDFLFVDPPYDSEKTILINGLLVKQNGNGFNSYTADKFTRENQKENFIKITDNLPKKPNALLIVKEIKERELLENVEYWEDLTLEKVKKLIFDSGLGEYLTNGQIKDLKVYCLGIEVGLGTHGRKNIGGK